MNVSDKQIKVFDYHPDLDAFTVRDEFASLSSRLEIAEWTPVVWMGRLFFMDNDFGEHIFDNWDERDEIEERAKQAGIDTDRLMIVCPDRFEDGNDGPCHSRAQRRRFWTDVFKSLSVSLDTLFSEATEIYMKRSPITGYFTYVDAMGLQRIINVICREYSVTRKVYFSEMCKTCGEFLPTNGNEQCEICIKNNDGH